MHKNSAWLINDVLQQSKRQCSSVECVINETSVEPNGLTQKLQVTLATWWLCRVSGQVRTDWSQRVCHG